MSVLQDLFEEWVGRGRRISAEQCGREANVSERTVDRWVRGKNEPDLAALRSMLSSTILAADFRRALADYLFQRSVDLRVVCEAPPLTQPHPNPLRLTFDLDAAVLDVQRSIERAVCEHGADGAKVTEAEQAEIEQFLTSVERLAAEARRSVRAKVARRTA